MRLARDSTRACATLVQRAEMLNSFIVALRVAYVVGVQMANYPSSLADIETELASIARMLTYIRDSARSLEAQAVEYCVEMALQAVANEIRERRELVIAGAGFDKTAHLLQ